jgi:hypothetical protein
MDAKSVDKGERFDVHRLLRRWRNERSGESYQ